MKGLLNLLVIIIILTAVANAISNPKGTTALFNGFSGLWKVGVNGVLGKPSS